MKAAIENNRKRFLPVLMDEWTGSVICFKKCRGWVFCGVLTEATR